MTRVRIAVACERCEELEDTCDVCLPTRCVWCGRQDETVQPIVVHVPADADWQGTAFTYTDLVCLDCRHDHGER